MFIHYVNFFLNDDAKGHAPQLIADCHEFLGGIPTVRQLFAGKPAMTPRDVVDNSYDVGLCVLFDDVTSHDIYQIHPMHDAFIARNKATWKTVVVRDFID